MKRWYICLCLILLLSGCGVSDRKSEKARDKISVTLVDSVFYTAEKQSAEIVYGEDCHFTLAMAEGFQFTSCSYADYETELEGDLLKLTLHQVTRPSRVTVSADRIREERPVEPSSVEICYRTGLTSEPEITKEYTLTNHLRPNTWNGAELVREGYTLLGWNTQQDGTGEHIGLGSRVTVPDGESCTLFAEWVPWIPEEQLRYEVTDGGEIRLTGYLGKGTEECFVIPEQIQGLPVTEIDRSFTVNIPCGKVSSPILVLPSSIRSVKDGAFWNSSFQELYLFDSIQKITEKAFSTNLKTYHINARMDPAFLKDNNSTFYADAVDLVLLSNPGRRLILFAGCSMDYGVDSSVLENALRQQYDVINLGLNGDIDAGFQMDVLTAILGEGDLFLHAPEQMSQCQLMYSHYLNNLAFIMTEGNYDLLSYGDFSNHTGFLAAFVKFLDYKRELPACTYEDGRWQGNFDHNGDYIEPREYLESTVAERDQTYSAYQYGYSEQMLTEEGMDQLAGYYDLLQEKGVQVFLSYAPVNENSKENIGEVHREAKIYAEKFETMLADRGWKVISEVEDYLYSGRYFYDSDYHLNDIGALLRTRQLYEDLSRTGI